MQNITIPNLSQKIIVKEPWTIKLLYCVQNAKILKELKCFSLLEYEAFLHLKMLNNNSVIHRRINYNLFESIYNLTTEFDVTLSPGTVLSLESIIKNRIKDSVKLNLLKTPDFDKKGRICFLISLEDFQTLKFDVDK